MFLFAKFVKTVRQVVESFLLFVHVKSWRKTQVSKRSFVPTVSFCGHILFIINQLPLHRQLNALGNLYVNEKHTVNYTYRSFDLNYFVWIVLHSYMVFEKCVIVSNQHAVLSFSQKFIKRQHEL